MRDKDIILTCLKILQSKKVDLVDAYIFAYAKENKIDAVYSFDSDIKKLGLELSDVK